MPTAIAPKDAAYPLVPTPKELELSRQLVQLQQEKDAMETKLMTQIRELETRVHKLDVELHDMTQLLHTTKREHVEMTQQAIETERNAWKQRVIDLEKALLHEKNDKEAQEKWILKYQTPSKPSDPDAAEQVFARFAQSIALLPSYMATKVTKSGVLSFLTHLLRENMSDLVTGSVLLALVHLAIHLKPAPDGVIARLLAQQKMALAYCGTEASSQPPAPLALSPRSPRSSSLLSIKEEIIKAGAAAPCVHVLETSSNERVLVEAARLCAALGTNVHNKRILSAKNAVRFLLKLLVPPASDSPAPQSDGMVPKAHVKPVELSDYDVTVQKNALSALVNLCNGTKVYSFIISLIMFMVDSEILRSQIANFDFMPIAVRYLQESYDLEVQTEAAKLLTNLACNHIVNQNTMMAAEAHLVATQLLLKHKTQRTVTRTTALVSACTMVLGNLAFTSVNQLAIGYGDTMTLLLQLTMESTVPSLLECTLQALTCICHQNTHNKNRFLAQNGLQVLLYLLSKPERYQMNTDVLIAACHCFSIVARTRASRCQVYAIDGQVPLLQLCRESDYNLSLLLEASAMAVCALVPTPSERIAMVADGKELKLETKQCGLRVLERAKHLLFASHGRTVPSWLSTAITLLQAPALDLKTAENMKLHVENVADEQETEPLEFRERRYFSMEIQTMIPPDELCPQFYQDERSRMES